MNSKRIFQMHQRLIYFTFHSFNNTSHSNNDISNHTKLTHNRTRSSHNRLTVHLTTNSRTCSEILITTNSHFNETPTTRSSINRDPRDPCQRRVTVTYRNISNITTAVSRRRLRRMMWTHECGKLSRKSTTSSATCRKSECKPTLSEAPEPTRTTWRSRTRWWRRSSRSIRWVRTVQQSRLSTRCAFDEKPRWDRSRRSSPYSNRMQSEAWVPCDLSCSLVSVCVLNVHISSFSSVLFCTAVCIRYSVCVCRCYVVVVTSIAY